jgi:hypothetical protein
MMWARDFSNKLNKLLKNCATWVRHWGGLRPAIPERPSISGNLTQALNLVYIPERGVWVSKMTYVYHSLEVRLQVEEAEAPPALRRLRKAWRIDP